MLLLNIVTLTLKDRGWVGCYGRHARRPPLRRKITGNSACRNVQWPRWVSAGCVSFDPHQSAVCAARARSRRVSADRRRRAGLCAQFPSNRVWRGYFAYEAAWASLWFKHKLTEHGYGSLHLLPHQRRNLRRVGGWSITVSRMCGAGDGPIRLTIVAVVLDYWRTI